MLRSYQTKVCLHSEPPNKLGGCQILLSGVRREPGQLIGRHSFNAFFWKQRISNHDNKNNHLSDALLNHSCGTKQVIATCLEKWPFRFKMTG